MPKLSNRPPKPPRHKSGKNVYAVVYTDGKKNNLGRWGSPEAKAAYARFEVEWWENHRRPIAERVPPTLTTTGTKTDTTVSEVALAFLQYVEATKRPDNFTHYRIAVMDFLVKHFGTTPADDFTAGSLNLIREAMIQSRRFCRLGVNDYTRRVVTLFQWGVSVGMVDRVTAWGLGTVKPLEPGHPGTFDHAEREYVTDDVIIATLPILPPTLQAMIKLQRLTGMRPSEVFNMLVGDIDTKSVPGI